MGDDTWMSVFPDLFEANMTFPYDSFDIEDLHTVDKGVIKYLFPLLEDPSKPFDFLIGHFLGIDHVGHYVGPVQIGDGHDWTKLHHLSTTGMFLSYYLPWLSCKEYLNYEGSKFSKSKNHGLFGVVAKETRIPASVWQYCLLSTRPETADAMFL